MKLISDEHTVYATTIDVAHACCIYYSIYIMWFIQVPLSLLLLYNGDLGSKVFLGLVLER